ncbi:MAG: response regulator transcription factor [Anaerolineae bacterium]|nr:response regulator transcription factor [Anaerolineae bacterium]
MIRVLLVDDRSVVRRGLLMRLALEPDLRVVGAAKSSEEAVMLARTTAPDVVVMDIEMPGVDGMQAIRQMRDLTPNGAVIVLTMHGGQAIRAQALEAGARAFVEKQGGAEPLLREIRRLAAPAAGP